MRAPFGPARPVATSAPDASRGRRAGRRTSRRSCRPRRAARRSRRHRREREPVRPRHATGDRRDEPVAVATPDDDRPGPPVPRERHAGERGRRGQDVGLRRRSSAGPRPGARAVERTPVTRSSTGSSCEDAGRRPDDRRRVERHGQGDQRTGRQGQADVPADGRQVPDLLRHHERPQALQDQVLRAPPRHRRQIGELTQGARRGDGEAVAHVEGRPAQTGQVHELGQVRLRFGEEPRPTGQRRAAGTDHQVRAGARRADAVERGQVHEAPECCLPR